jgi:hypothetical protein
LVYAGKAKSITHSRTPDATIMASPLQLSRHYPQERKKMMMELIWQVQGTGIRNK